MTETHVQVDIMDIPQRILLLGGVLTFFPCAFTGFAAGSVSALGSGLGSGQPANCVKNFRITENLTDIIIVPGVMNCFSCELDTLGNVTWQVSSGGTLISVSLSPYAKDIGDTLVITTPETYIQPGTLGQQSIICISASTVGHNLVARLVSPVLVQPLFADVTVNEGDLLNLTCVTMNLPEVSTFQILDPNGMRVHDNFGVFSMPNISRIYAGIYACVITSTIDDSTVNETSNVIIQYAAEITELSTSPTSHGHIRLGYTFLLECGYAGVPTPTVQWFHNESLLLRENDVNIYTRRPGSINIFIGKVEYRHKGTYSCRANNSLGSDEADYTVTVQFIETPPQFVDQQHPNVYIYETDMNGTRQNLILPCPVMNSSMVTFTWFRENQKVSQNKVDSFGNLTIVNITEGEHASRDGVHYHCVATKIIGTSYKYAVSVRSRNITVFYAFFDGFEHNATEDIFVPVALNSDVALECDVLPANPPPQIRWLQDGNKQIAEIKNNNEIRFLDGGRYLYMRSLTPVNLASTYSCVVTNALLDHEISAPTTYRLIGNLTEGVLMDYKQIGTLEAFVGNISFEFAYIGGIFGKNSSNSTTNCYLSSSDVEISVLGNIARINSINMVGMSTLMATVTYGGGEITSRNGNLTVYELPQIILHFTYDIIEAGQPYTLLCTIRRGSPTPTLQWHFNGQPILPDNNNNGVMLSRLTTVLSIIIPSPTVSHSGIYQCFASNEFGDHHSFWHIHVIEDNAKSAIDCEAETILTENEITYSRPKTLRGETATLTCPLNNSDILVMRNCSHDGMWQPINDNGCDTDSGQLDGFSGSFANDTDESSGGALSILSQIAELAENNTAEQTTEVLSQVASYFEELADFVNKSNVTINRTVIVDIVHVISSLLQWEPDNIIVANSSSVVESFEIVVYTYAQQLDLNEIQNFTTPSLTLITERRSVDSFVQRGRSYLIGENEVMFAPGDQIEDGQLSSQLDAAIGLPASLFGRINDRDNIGVFVALYEIPILFPVGGENIRSNALKQTIVGSHVLAATVGPGINFQNLDETVTIVFRLQPANEIFIAQGTEICVSWDFTLQDWIPNGCTTKIGQDDNIITCNCNHLTNFAVLVDICSRQVDCEHSKVDQALTYISYIGITISLICLVFTLLTLLMFKKIREKDISKYHIQLCIALLLMFSLTLILVVLSAEEVTTIYGGCVSLSFLVHYFTLVAVMWMGAEALLMFQKLVIVFVRISTKFIAVVSIICWTVPIAFVLIPLIMDFTNGHDITSDITIHRASTRDDVSYCFLSHIGVLIGAFLAPILVILMFNVVIFICVFIVVIRHAREKAARIKRPISNKSIMRLAISISGVLFLFGLSWLFFVLTFSRPGLRETFQILFTVFNSLQGFFVLTFILFTEGFDYWKALLSCKKHKSKHIQSSLDASTSANKSKQNSTDPFLSIQSKNIPSIQNTEKPSLILSKDLEVLQLSTNSASSTESADNASNSLYQITSMLLYQSSNAIGSETQEMENDVYLHYCNTFEGSCQSLFSPEADEASCGGRGDKNAC